MKTLRIALVLALAAPAGAIELGVSPALGPAGRAAVPPVAALGLPVSAPQFAPSVVLDLGRSASPAVLPAAAIASPLSAAAVAPAAAGASFKTLAVDLKAPEASFAALPSVGVLKDLGAVKDLDLQKLNAGYDGASEKLSVMAAANGGGSSASNGGGAAGGAGGAGSGSGSGSGAVLAALVAKIEAAGRVQVVSPAGDAIKFIAPKVEKTANGQKLSIVILTGKVDAAGAFTKTGIAAVAKSAEQTETQLTLTKVKRQDLETATQITAALDGTADKTAGMVQDHTDIIETTLHDAAAKQADYQKELAAALSLSGSQDLKALQDKIEQTGQQVGPLSFGILLDQKQSPDGSQSQFIAVLELDPQTGAPGSMQLVRTSVKPLPHAGKGNKAREEHMVYTADISGALQGVEQTGKDHSLDVSDFNKAADAAAQAEFDAIVAKVSQP